MKFNLFLLLFLLFSCLWCIDSFDNKTFVFDQDNFISKKFYLDVTTSLKEIYDKTGFTIKVYLINHNKLEELIDSIEDNSNSLSIVVLNYDQYAELEIISGNNSIISDSKIDELSNFVVPYLLNQKFDSSLSVLILSMSKILENHYKVKFRSTSVFQKVKPVKNKSLTVILIILFIIFFITLIRSEFYIILQKFGIKRTYNKKIYSGLYGFEGFSKFGGDFARRKRR